jgi:DNA-binding transcriptional LysR family regulator
MVAPADSVDDLVLLAAVVEAGGFSAASARTGIPKSRLSRRITALEQRLGVALIRRDPRHFEVTEAGLRICAHGQRIRESAQAAWDEAHARLGEPSGLLRVACPVAMAAAILAPFAGAFLLRYPRVQLAIATTTGMVEALAERADLVLHPASVPMPDSRMVARRLYQAPFMLVAAPGVADGLTDPQALAQVRVLGWEYMGPLQRWTLVHTQGDTVEVPVQPCLVSDNLLVLREAALAGAGVAPMSALMCGEEIAQGRLRVVAPGWSPPPATFYAVYASRTALPRAGRVFLDELIVHLAEKYGDGGAGSATTPSGSRKVPG